MELNQNFVKLLKEQVIQDAAANAVRKRVEAAVGKTGPIKMGDTVADDRSGTKFKVTDLEIWEGEKGIEVTATGLFKDYAAKKLPRGVKTVLITWRQMGLRGAPK